MDPNLSPSSAEQARLELSVAASSTERANRPRYLVIVAALLLLGSGVYALTGLSARAEALSKVTSERDRTDEVLGKVQEYRDLVEAAANRGFKTDPYVGSTLERLAKEAGLRPTGQISTGETGAGTVPGMAQMQYRAAFANQDPTALLSFLGMVQAQSDPSGALPGIGIASLKIVPSGQSLDGQSGTVGWNMDVEFTRWERKEQR